MTEQSVFLGRLYMAQTTPMNLFLNIIHGQRSVQHEVGHALPHPHIFFNCLFLHPSNRVAVIICTTSLPTLPTHNVSQAPYVVSAIRATVFPPQTRDHRLGHPFLPSTYPPGQFCSRSMPLDLRLATVHAGSLSLKTSCRWVGPLLGYAT
ncbi:hypothetical protein K491DRAFT_461484 [Lophiostoma macrostomum CBS 122681]|uniref:Uncharacterized protein n=1 Tax=Lophiostoma macrostomum CBS 122681 TaxID=1314788 RepID=A0A6A6T741_9PLEO|nr:hypothetical protein K491DRAFT_461484 [Lophiostoma macrostomum CBS 122681]